MENNDMLSDYDFSKGIRGKHTKTDAKGNKANEWDRQIDQDVIAGKFDKINAKVDRSFDTGRCKPL